MRLSKVKKLALARAIAKAALEILQNCGRLERLDNCGLAVQRGERGRMSFLHATPFSHLSRVPGYLIVIWFDHHKVFSFRWPPEDIIQFRYGPWMNILVPKSFSDSTKSGRFPRAPSRQNPTEVLAPNKIFPGGCLRWIVDEKTGKRILMLCVPLKSQ
jgi:hypothetical protein